MGRWWTVVVFLVSSTEAVIQWTRPPGGAGSTNLGEGVTTGFGVYTLTATTDDAGGILQYSIVAQTEAGVFAVTSGVPSGYITVADGTKLDYDGLTKVHVVTVTARDATETQSATVTIRLTDINDLSPVFDKTLYSVNIHSGANEGTPVTGIKATDNDGTSPNNEVAYVIVSGNTDSAFTVDRTTGEITVTQGKTLDSSVLSAYLLMVEARDQGTVPAPRTAATTVAIGVNSGYDVIHRKNVTMVLTLLTMVVVLYCF